MAQQRKARRVQIGDARYDDEALPPALDRRHRGGRVTEMEEDDESEKKKAFRSAWFFNSVLGWSYLALLLGFIFLLKFGCQLPL